MISNALWLRKRAQNFLSPNSGLPTTSTHPHQQSPPPRVNGHYHHLARQRTATRWPSLSIGFLFLSFFFPLYATITSLALESIHVHHLSPSVPICVYHLSRPLECTSPFTPPAYTTVSNTPKLLVPIWGVPVRSILFVGLCESFATLCVSVHVFDVSAGLSSPGKFGDTDVIDGFSELLATLCVHVCMPDMSAWSLGLSACCADCRCHR